MGITAQTGRCIWDKTIELYFGTTGKNVPDTIEQKVSLVSFTRLLRSGVLRGDSAEFNAFNKSKVVELTEK